MPSLLKDKSVVSYEDVLKSAERAIIFLGYDDLDIDINDVVKAIQRQKAARIVGPVATSVNLPHNEWLPAKQGAIEWNLWDRYRLWLEEEQNRGPNLLDPLELAVNEIVGHLEDPTREGIWDRRGLVVGDIQSGKTGHYIGVINKAIDAGYKVIIVLAGLNNSLRAQTQIRFDEGVYGWETDVPLIQKLGLEPKIGVGAAHICESPLDSKYFMEGYTVRTDRGDFNKATADKSPGGLPPHPIFFVTKKNVTVLGQLRSWLETKGAQLDVPMLLIDDEADHASINTKVLERDQDGNVLPDSDPTAINGHIRAILKLFSRNAMVGYTATPFANFLVPQDQVNKLLDDDLFPRDFITTLESPNIYVGAAQMMGVGADPEHPEGPVMDSGPLGLLRPIEDSHHFDHSKKEFKIDELPESLKEAVRAFVLSHAARDLRGHAGQHNSMLVHVSRFNLVQDQVVELLQRYILEMKNRLNHGEGDNPVLLPELKRQWEEDYIPTSQWVKEEGGPLAEEHPYIGWGEDLVARIEAAVFRIQVRGINGTSGDALMYKDNPDGMSVIAVGGDKLSRGLTLEGLTVNYYLRSAKAYDTLFQMGRWFGYRPGYLDLCRVFSTRGIFGHYSHVAKVEAEIHQEIKTMRRLRKSPKDFCLHIQTHSGALSITAYNKQRNGQEMRLGYSGRSAESIVFSKHPGEISENYTRISKFLEHSCATGTVAHDPVKTRGNYVFRNVDGKEVADLFWKDASDSLHGSDTARTARPELVATYIKNRLKDNELTTWTVALIDSHQGRKYVVNGLPLGLTTRGNKADKDAPENAGYSFKRLISPDDELLDMDPGLLEAARMGNLEEQREEWREDCLPGDPSDDAPIHPGKIAEIFRKRLRNSANGLLILYPLDPVVAGLSEESEPIMGWAISFPASPTEPGDIKYLIAKEFGADALAEEIEHVD